jgi:alpha-L-fucosidase
MGAIGVSFCITAVAAQSTLDSLQRAYVNLRYGMFVCFGIETFNGGDYWNNPTPPAASVWNPVDTPNCKNWADAAKAAKMTYGLLTTKHHYGFCLWNTSTTAYNCMNEGAVRVDVVKAYCDAFRADGLLPGLYYSMFDVHESIDGGYSSYNPALWNKKKAFIEQQLRELLTNYGPIPILDIDGWAWRMGHNTIPYQEIRDFVKSLQPDCLIADHDGVGQPWDEDIVLYEEPKGIYCPTTNTDAAHQEQTIVTQASGSWFWTGGGAYMTAANILSHLANLEPKYCNFLLDCPPTAAGILPSAMIDSIEKAGNSWSPNPGRAPLPTQPHHVEFSVTPIAATAGGGANGWNAIDGYNDRSSATAIDQTLLTMRGAPPQTVTVDLGAQYANLEILGYLPRQDYSGNAHVMTGNITGYTISVSSDNVNFTKVDSGTWSGDSTLKIAEWSPPATGRYVQLKAVSTVGNDSAVINELEFGGRLDTPTVATTGVRDRPTRPATPGNNPHYFTSATGKVRLAPGESSSLSVYTVSGRLIGRVAENPLYIDIRTILGGSNQLYIIKTAP